MLSEFEYIKNCKTISHIQSLVSDNKSIKPKEFTHQTNRVTFIIYRPGARGIRRNITRSDDISRGALPRGKYHH